MYYYNTRVHVLIINIKIRQLQNCIVGVPDDLTNYDWNVHIDSTILEISFPKQYTENTVKPELFCDHE